MGLSILLAHLKTYLKKRGSLWDETGSGQAAANGSLERILQAKSKKQAENRKSSQANLLSPHLLPGSF